MSTLKNIIIIAGLQCLVVAANAQESGFNYGTRFAIGEASIKSEGFDNLDGKLFIGGGIGTEYRFSPLLSLMTDFLLTSKGGRGTGKIVEQNVGFIGNNTTTYEYDERVDLLSVEIPVMLKIGVGSEDFHAGIFAGPGINFNLVGVSSRNFEDDNYNEDNGYVNKEFKDRETTEYSFTYGIGASVVANNGNMFSLDVRRSDGFTDFGTLNGKAMRSEYIAVSIAYTL
jgi:hypothetical protein